MEAPDEHNSSGSARPVKILVTGATGFIGGHIARHLVSQGMVVSCLARESSKASFIQGLPVKLVKGDITDLASLRLAFQGQDTIIHTAGKVGDWGSYDSFYQANVTGTLNVLQAAYENAINRVLITGSVSSYGEENFNGVKDESSPFKSHYPYFMHTCFPSGMNHYRDTKALMTREAIDFAGKLGINLLILEPVWVYGENEFNTGFYEYLKSVKAGIRVMPGSRENTFHVIYAGELARAYFLAACSKLQGIHRIIIGSSSPENMVGIYRDFCEEADLKMPLLLPKFMTYPIGFILEMFATIFKAKNPPLLTRARVNMFYDSIGYDTSKASQLLHFENMVPRKEGIKKTVQWYRDNNML
jgi:nucleoside-diphosphate-sugar epimerase